MKLCANISTLFTEHPLAERFAAARQNGFNAVEIQFPYDEDLQLLIDRQQQADTRIALINVPAGDLMAGGLGLACSPNTTDAFRHAVDQCLIYGESLQVDCVNVLAGRVPDQKQSDRCFDVFLHNLEYCADQFQSIGVTTVFEAINTYDMPDFLIHSVAQMQQVLKDLNHRTVKMQYDLYHMARMNEPTQALLPQILSDIGHLQFADTPHRHQPGTGNLAFEKIIQQLQDLRYDKWIGAEYKPDGNTEDSLDWMSLFS
ncbi:TIM barrel protein [Aestuariicella hydrocarbonica]|uniref:TIM barrel protein n=1 Tax=Pseudomaricurvus hydrocarbonicus TaxID=1470433 RepID=A0A9E5JTW7_9GAMM|nr:TIM barrel protein [Aestuariicella hydrocarbonica]NHO65503.1 TIM barrel protein [Aestuariicella hydrocarbonica]